MIKTDRKTGAGGVAGAGSVILCWLIHDVGGVDVPPEVAAALTVLLSGVVSHVVTQ